MGFLLRRDLHHACSAHSATTRSRAGRNLSSQLVPVHNDGHSKATGIHIQTTKVLPGGWTTRKDSASTCRRRVFVHTAGAVTRPTRIGALAVELPLLQPWELIPAPDVLWRFLRPHSARGTVVATCSIVLSTLLLGAPSAWDMKYATHGAIGLLALLCGNGYVVGLNQIIDVKADAISKPFLPIASGELSLSSAWLLVLTFLATGLTLIITNFPPVVTALYMLGLLLGTIYTVPPLHLKEKPIAAVLTIAMARGLVLNLLVFYATRAVMELPFIWSPHIIFITAVSTISAVVIAITKDLYDHPIRRGCMEPWGLTAPVKACIGSGILTLTYVAASAWSWMNQGILNTPAMMGGHLFLCIVLLNRLWDLHKHQYSKQASFQFHLLTWNLYYAEYLLLPLIIL